MSFINALASGGLTVGLRIADNSANSIAAIKQRENLPAEDKQACCPVETKPPAQKSRPKPEEQSAEERAAGRASASGRLAAEGCLGRLQAEEEKGKAEEQKGWGEESEEAGGTPAAPQNLTEEEKQEVQQLQQRDREVKAHEQAHMSAAAGLAGAPSYEYQTGPDGKRYAVGGEVNVRTSGSSNPEQALREAETVKRAATAPAEPSSADRAAAARASADINRLKSEAAEKRREATGAGDDSAQPAQGEPVPNQAAPAANGEPVEARALGAYNTVRLGTAAGFGRALLAQA